MYVYILYILKIACSTIYQERDIYTYIYCHALKLRLHLHVTHTHNLTNIYTYVYRTWVLLMCMSRRVYVPRCVCVSVSANYVCVHLLIKKNTLSIVWSIRLQNVLTHSYIYACIQICHLSYRDHHTYIHDQIKQVRSGQTVIQAHILFVAVRVTVCVAVRIAVCVAMSYRLPHPQNLRTTS